MSEIKTLGDKLTERAKQLTAMIEQSLANHNALLGMLKNTNDILQEIGTVANAVSPNSAVTEVLNAVEEIDNVVESAGEQSTPAQ